jgi:hypothetical protein
MRVPKQCLGSSWRQFQHTGLALTSTFLLAASACGPTSEVPDVPEASRLGHAESALTGSAVIEPEADTFVIYAVSDGNFGDWDLVELSPPYASAYQNAFVYLRFDLSGVPADVTIQSVKLQMTAFQGQDRGGDATVYTYLVPNDSWAEMSTTWRNMPAVSGGALGHWSITYPPNATYDQVRVNEDPALADAVRAELAGDKKISLRLSSPGYLTEYHSREYSDASKRPQLIITYSDEQPDCASQPPTLSLNGGAELALECHSGPYVDPGAQAFDGCGEPLTVHAYNTGSDSSGPGPNPNVVGDYTVSYAAWNSAGDVTAARTVHVVDQTPPTLTLNGDAHMTHTCGSQWVDPGAEASDTCFGDLTHTIWHSGEVNGWAEGTYTVTYTVTDGSGNNAPPVTRTVDVVNCPW